MSKTPLPAFLVRYTDSSFTNPHEVARPDAPEDRRGQFTHMGARFWGFETGRHRGHTVDGTGIRFDAGAHHELVLRLETDASVEAIAISTAFFTGNQVPAVAVDLREEDGTWREVLARAPLAPDAEQRFELPPTRARECRLRCYQEGGIARVLLFGSAVADPTPAPRNLLADASISHVSNEHYGNPAMALRGVRAEDHMIGWESARTGFGEQALFTLARPARCTTLVVDTYLHRLNPPLSCHLFGLEPGVDVEAAMTARPRWTARHDDGARSEPADFAGWMHGCGWEAEGRSGRFAVELTTSPDGPFRPLLPFAALAPDTWHRLPLSVAPAVEHLLFLFYPNGGVHGLAVHGEVD
jgi:allantoicase